MTVNILDWNQCRSLKKIWILPVEETAGAEAAEKQKAEKEDEQDCQDDPHDAPNGDGCPQLHLSHAEVELGTWGVEQGSRAVVLRGDAYQRIPAHHGYIYFELKENDYVLTFNLFDTIFFIMI